MVNRSYASDICYANLRILCPFASQRWTKGFDYHATILLKKKTPTKVGVSFLVEMVVIETTSESLFPKLSTSVFVILTFPLRNA